jgi:hypothetical protein
LGETQFAYPEVRTAGIEPHLKNAGLRGKQTKNRKPLLLPLPSDLATLLRSTRKDAGPVFNATNLVHAFRKASAAAGLGKGRDPGIGTPGMTD